MIRQSNIKPTKPINPSLSTLDRDSIFKAIDVLLLNQTAMSNSATAETNMDDLFKLRYEIAARCADVMTFVSGLNIKPKSEIISDLDKFLNTKFEHPAAEKCSFYISVIKKILAH